MIDRSKATRAVFVGTCVLVVTVLLLSLVPTTAHAAGKPGGPKAGQNSGKNGGKSGGKARPTVVRGTLAALPPIVQPGAAAADPQNTGSLLATFTPANPGQKVTLERRTPRGWTKYATAREDAWGSAAFAPKRGTYRAFTTSDKRMWVTGTVTTERWHADFEDTFSGTELNTTVWNDQKREHESVYAPRTCARTSPAARRVQDGVLHLGVAADPDYAGQACSYVNKGVAGTSTYMLNSQVATEYTRSFRHGIVAARIKPQRSKGMHSGFWMLPTGTKYVDGDPQGGTEIDVMEFFGENGRGTETIGSHVHYYEANWKKVTLGSTFPEARRSLGEGKNWWDEFHVYSVEWTAHEYIFRIDGREYYREAKAVSQVPQYLVLSNLTSDYELKNLTADKFGDAAQVDWVRVFDATSRQASKVSSGRRAA
ncbi:glycoside hydrolase family 16 protein [Nocardioides hwasunensis]|uniref:Glycoside hydrolase family 16 protein n=1 Tax=Nocardioides hwasunensis TaxID=397258 RepID=A0ABR8MKR9_9ACTN|nr:glycoside hydrolase family 16 protein [Nocardioides hwasunensis]MBD3915375.1 glycoside hydrolase family 16 protein [Nocardioides hwasunensis]